MKVYSTNIFLNSEGRRTFIGAFSSWQAFADALGVSRTKAYVDGAIITNQYALENPNKVFMIIEDDSRGGKFVGYKEFKSASKNEECDKK